MEWTRDADGEPRGGHQVRQASEADVAAALADVAGLGPHFAVCTAPGLAADGAGLDDLIASTGTSLGVSEPRVAASTVQLAVAARLWSPVLSCALLHGLVPSLAGVRYLAGPLRLWLPGRHGLRVNAQERLSTPIYRTVVEDGLEPLHAELRHQVKLADGLLWGNAASALVGTLRVIVNARPALGGAAGELAAALLSAGRLRGSGDLTGSGLRFRRRSCCLYYRVPGGGLCGDCVLDSVPG